ESYDVAAVNDGLQCSASFFFQAEDGIRDRNVTGVQTCALPIYLADCKTDKIHKNKIKDQRNGNAHHIQWNLHNEFSLKAEHDYRSEERRVGKECRCRKRSTRY